MDHYKLEYLRNSFSIGGTQQQVLCQLLIPIDHKNFKAAESHWISISSHVSIPFGKTRKRFGIFPTNKASAGSVRYVSTD